jgi:hypothetical protein
LSYPIFYFGSLLCLGEFLPQHTKAGTLRIFMYRINLFDWDLRDLDLLNQLEYQNMSEMGNVLFKVAISTLKVRLLSNLENKGSWIAKSSLQPRQHACRSTSQCTEILWET